MTEWTGSCHCGAVRFRIEADITDVYRCDCSLCAMKGALMTSVHEDCFTLLAGADRLSEFNWNTGVARHFFCSVCGIYPFHKKRAMPDHYGINVHCLDGFDASALTVRAAEGKGMTVNPEGARDTWLGPRTP
ncbi:MAG: GFA family protein [Hyphomonas sp.]|nr:GFA family protein [Hyphomonas sp.]